MLHNILTGYRKHTAADLHNKYSEYNTFIQHMPYRQLFSAYPIGSCCSQNKFVRTYFIKVSTQLNV